MLPCSPSGASTRGVAPGSLCCSAVAVHASHLSFKMRRSLFVLLMCKLPQCEGSANARPPLSHSLYVLFNCMGIIMPLSLVRLSGVNVLQESESEGGWRGREKPESGRGKATAAKFRTVPMTPGGCSAGVSPVGTEQVNTEPCNALSSRSVCGTFCSASCRRRPG